MMREGERKEGKEGGVEGGGERVGRGGGRRFRRTERDDRRKEGGYFCISKYSLGIGTEARRKGRKEGRKEQRNKRTRRAIAG